MRPMLCSFFALGAAVGAELDVHDLRLSAGTTPPLGSVEERVSGSGTTIDGNTDAGSGLTLSLGYHGARIHSGGGFAWGVGVESISIGYRSELSDENDRLSGWGPYAQFGYAYAFTPAIHLEVGPHLGFGIARSEIHRSGFAGTSTTSGFYYQIAARLGVYAALAEHLVLGVEGGYGRFGAVFSNVDENGVDDYALAGTGFTVRGTIGVRF